MFVFVDMFDLNVEESGWVDGDVSVFFDMLGQLYFVGVFDFSLFFVEFFIIDEFFKLV